MNQSWKLGVQMWTVRNHLTTDVEGTLRRIADLGYNGVELWFRDWPDDPARLRGILSDLGLLAPSAHVPFLSLRDDFERVADYHRELGTSYLTIPSIPADLRGSAESWRKRIQEIRAIAEACAASGFVAAYHNHGFEFEETVDGDVAHDYLFRSIPGDLLKAEIDTFFVKGAGRDPAAYVRRFASRMPVLHLKDQDREDPKRNSDIGAGTVDWTAVREAIDPSVLEWCFVEQNCGDADEFESLATSLSNLRSLGY